MTDTTPEPSDYTTALAQLAETNRKLEELLALIAEARPIKLYPRGGDPWPD